MFGLHASDSVVSLAVHRGQYLNDPTGPTVQGRKCQLLLGPKQDCLTDLEPVICHGEASMATHDAPRNDSASGAGANAGPAVAQPSKQLDFIWLGVGIAGVRKKQLLAINLVGGDGLLALIRH